MGPPRANISLRGALLAPRARRRAGRRPRRGLGPLDRGSPHARASHARRTTERPRKRRRLRPLRDASWKLVPPWRERFSLHPSWACRRPGLAGPSPPPRSAAPTAPALAGACSAAPPAHGRRRPALRPPRRAHGPPRRRAPRPRCEGDRGASCPAWAKSSRAGRPPSRARESTPVPALRRFRAWRRARGPRASGGPRPRAATPARPPAPVAPRRGAASRAGSAPGGRARRP